MERKSLALFFLVAPLILLSKATSAATVELNSITQIINGTTIDFENFATHSPANDVLQNHNMVSSRGDGGSVTTFVTWVEGNIDAPISGNALFAANHLIETTGDPWHQIGLTGNSGELDDQIRHLTLNAFDQAGNLIMSISRDHIGTPISGPSGTWIQLANERTVFLGISSDTAIYSIELLSSGSVAWDNLTYSTSEVPVPAAAWLFGSALIGLAGIKRKK
jgi:hypothetical protein